jgi:hypothetical protein
MIVTESTKKISPFSSFVFVLAFLAVACVILFKIVMDSSADAPNNTQYRRVVTIDNTTNASSLTNYQVLVTVDTATLISESKMQSDCDDIRFLDDDDETNLDYWIETDNSNGCNTTTTRIWVKVPSIGANASKTIYMYYGDSGLAAGSNGANTFIFFDDFTTFNQSVWSSTNGTNGYSQTSSTLTITSGAIYTNTTIGTQPDQINEAQVTWTNTDTNQSGFQIGNQQGTNSGNSSSVALAYLLKGSGVNTLYGLAATGSSPSYDIATSNNDLQAMTIGTKYIIGHIVTSSNVLFQVNRSTVPGTESPHTPGWSGNYYMWLGYFRGANSGATDIPDMDVDWVLTRKYTATAPTVTVASESDSNARYSLRFYGNGVTAGDLDRVKIPIDNPERPVDVGMDFTIEFWMKGTMADNDDGTCSASDSSGDGWTTGNIIFDRDIFGTPDDGDFGISVTNTGNLCFGVSNASTGTTIVSSGANVLDGNWHHVAVTRTSSSGATSIYILH